MEFTMIQPNDLAVEGEVLGEGFGGFRGLGLGVHLCLWSEFLAWSRYVSFASFSCALAMLRKWDARTEEPSVIPLETVGWGLVGGHYHRSGVPPVPSWCSLHDSRIVSRIETFHPYLAPALKDYQLFI